MPTSIKPDLRAPMGADQVLTRNAQPSFINDWENTMFTRTTLESDRDPDSGASAELAGLSAPVPGADIFFGAAGSASDNLPCRVQDPDLWFAETPDQLNQAKQFCSGCPVRLACLAGAIARREPWGVWGGEIFEHGAVIARKRPRGRPRKDAQEVAA